jgi:hypothetical protein
MRGFSFSRDYLELPSEESSFIAASKNPSKCVRPLLSGDFLYGETRRNDPAEETLSSFNKIRK